LCEVRQRFGTACAPRLGHAMALDQAAIQRVLDWAYDKAVDGVPGLDSAEELASSYTQGPGTAVDKCNALIRWQVAKASATGFLSGLGGLLTLPVTLPASMSVVLLVQLRMIAAIAHIGGHDIRDDRVKTLIYLCLCGNAATEIARGMGIRFGVRLAQRTIERISGQALIQINQRVGFRLLTKFGEKGILNLGKAVPLVGGVIGGAFDGTFTNQVGNVARAMFVESAELDSVES
jgi:hypothetical protein